MTRDECGDPIDPHDVLDRAELADYYAAERNKPPRRPRSVPVHRPFTWEPTEADREAGREA